MVKQQMNERIEKLIRDIDQAYKASPTPIPAVRALVHSFSYEESVEDAEIYHLEHKRLLAIKNRKAKERVAE